MLDLPLGWGATEVAEDDARRALASWDDTASAAISLDRVLVLAESLRRLLDQLALDRQVRHA